MNAEGFAKTMQSSSPLLELRNGTKKFGGLTAVGDVSFAVAEGEILGLIGPNGAGKSTLFNLLTGVAPLTSGEIVFAGSNISAMPLHKRTTIGMSRTFQIVRLFHGMTVLENVLMGFHPLLADGLLRSIFGFGRTIRQEQASIDRAMELLGFVGLRELAHEEIGHLPHGKQRLVEIARALAIDPRMLLLDEPAAGLNDQETANLGRMLRALNARGVTVLIVEHDIDFIMGLCHRIVVLDHGTKIAEDVPSGIQSNEKVIEAYLGRRNKHVEG